MVMSTQIKPMDSSSSGALLEKVMISNDLSGLTPFEKVTHIKNVCDSLGLNPLTRPIQLIKFQNKEVPYFTKDATEQLRKNNNISITDIESKIMNGVYTVKAQALTPEGRTDAATGAVQIDGLKGENLCNAMLKAETKAKRRVTLSICGLGYLDESEVESMAGAKKIDIHAKVINEDNIQIEEVNYSLEEFNLIISSIASANTEDELKAALKGVKQSKFKNNPDLFKQVIDAKDKRKDLIAVQKFKDELAMDTIDEETGEVLS